MEKFVKGDVVVVPFPFSNLKKSKKRPALILATLKGHDVILAQITSKKRYDNYSIPLSNTGLREGSLPVESVIRPNRLFTAETSIIIYKLGSVKKSIQNKINESLQHIFNN